MAWAVLFRSKANFEERPSSLRCRTYWVGLFWYLYCLAQRRACLWMEWSDASFVPSSYHSAFLCVQVCVCVCVSELGVCVWMVVWIPEKKNTAGVSVWCAFLGSAKANRPWAQLFSFVFLWKAPTSLLSSLKEDKNFRPRSRSRNLGFRWIVRSTYCKTGYSVIFIWIGLCDFN